MSRTVPACQELRPNAWSSLTHNLERVLVPPWWWTLLTLALVLLSAVEFSRASSHDWALKCSVSATTVALVAALWLPGFVRLFAIFGGGLKTPAGDVNGGGVLPLLEKLDADSRKVVLASLISSVEEVEAQLPPDGRTATRGAVRTLIGDLSTLLPSGAGAKSQLRELASQYEAVRATTASSPERTRRMGELVAQMRALQPKLRLGPDDLRLLYDDAELPVGGRVAALALVRNAPAPAHLPLLLRSIQSPRKDSAFEQYQALMALEDLAPALALEDARAAQGVLQRAWDADAVGIRQDGSRRNAAQHLLKLLPQTA